MLNTNRKKINVKILYLKDGMMIEKMCSTYP